MAACAAGRAEKYERSRASWEVFRAHHFLRNGIEGFERGGLRAPIKPVPSDECSWVVPKAELKYGDLAECSCEEKTECQNNEPEEDKYGYPGGIHVHSIPEPIGLGISEAKSEVVSETCR